MSLCEQRAVSSSVRRRPKHALLKVFDAAQAHAHDGAYHPSVASAHSREVREGTYITSVKRPMRGVQCVSQARLGKGG